MHAMQELNLSPETELYILNIRLKRFSASAVLCGVQTKLCRAPFPPSANLKSQYRKLYSYPPTDIL